MFEKKRGTRFLASVMALVMLLSLAPVGALAADEETLTEESPAVTQPAVKDENQQAVVDTPENGETTNSDADDGVANLPLLDENRPVADNSEAEIIPEKELIDEAFGVDSKDEIQQYGSKENGNAVVQCSVSGSNTVKVGETITLTCNNKFHWPSHNWYTFGNSVAVEGDTDSNTITVKGLKEGTATVYCSGDSKQINVTDPQYVIRFYVSGTGTEGRYDEQHKYSVAGQPNSTFENAVGGNPLALSVSAGYAILTGCNDTAKNISTNDFENVRVTGDEAVRAWLTEYANHGVPEGLTNRENVESIVAQVNKQYETANNEFYQRDLLPSLQTNYFNGFRFVDAYYVDIGESTIHVNVQLVKNTEYTVHYDSNDGTENVSYDSNLYQKGDSVTVKNNMFTRTGYEFDGWNTKEDGTGTDYASGDTFNIENANVTLYAKWAPKQYKVSYSFISGTTGEVLPTEVTDQLPDETEALNGSEVMAHTSFNSVAVKNANDVVIGTWNFERWNPEKQTVNGQDISFEGTWKYTAAKYKVSYSFVSGTTGEVLPTEVTDQLPDETEALNGSEVMAHTSFNSVAVKNANDVVIGTWNFERWNPEKQTVNGQDISFEGTWIYTVAPAPGEWKYTVNQHFINAKGEKTDRGTSVTVADTTVTTLQDSIPDGMQQNQNFGDPAQNYVYIAKETTYQVNSEKKNASDSLANGAVIDLYYYLDVIGEEKPDAPDGTPDCYQVTIIYKSSDESRGKISDASPKKEVLTIEDEEGNRLSSGKVEITGASAEVTGSSCYFSSWINDAKVETSTAGAILGKQTIKNAKGGDVYTFTANFDRSSGGGSGGSNRPKPPVVEIPDDVPTGLNGKDHYAYIIGYGNNDVRPQNNITRAEVATIFFRLLTDETREANMTKSNGYNDVKDGDWFCCAVSTLSKMGIIKGYEDGSFKPNDPISRAEFAAIAARFDPDGDKTPASFFDVTSHWAKDEISIAANHGWIKGYEDGSFKPDQKITRAETMTLVNRVLNRLPEAKDDLHKDMKTWVDNMDETAWYYLAVQEATNSHYFKNKTGTKFEQWTDLRDTRDWSELEK